MKRKFTFPACVLTLMLLFQQAKALPPVAGDYQSNQSGIDHSWFTPGNWQVFDGSSWVTATTYPTAADGVITIQGTDSLTLNGISISIDSLVISASAALNVFNGTFTLNNVAGDDITVDGHLWLGTSCIMTGPGSIVVNNSGRIVLRNSCRLGVASTVNNGNGETNNNATIETGSFTNNLSFSWTGTTNTNLLLNNGAVFNNNGTFQTTGTGNRTINSTVTSGTFNNNGTGIINNGGNLFSIFSVVTFNNQGDIRGTGTNNFQNVATASAGSITPGGTSGAGLTVNGSLISTKPTTINIQVLTAAGPGNDTLYLTSSSNVDLSSATLNVTDNNAAPPGPYTIMTISSGAGNFLGTGVADFGAVNIPPNYGNLKITAKAITVDKLYVLPLTWGSFTTRQNDGKVDLNWTTLQESNVSHFVIEHSTDGLKYTAIGTVNARGNSNEKVAYAFEHGNPKYNARNFYRIVEIDLDGQSAYSVVRTVKLGDNNNGAIALRSNPVQNGTLLVESDLTNTNAFITGIDGAVIKDIRLHQGINNINVNSLPAGVYTINVFDNKSRIFSGKFVKR